MKHLSRLFRALFGALLCVAALHAGAQTDTVNLLHALNGTTDGSGPAAPLMQASDGNFYGITQSSGASSGGTVFRYTPGTGGAAGTYKVLHAFDPNVDGSVMTTNAGLTEGPDGNLYGVTASGGTDGNGVFFRITLSTGAYKVITNFGEESYEPSTLTVGSDGNFYTTTLYGGANSNGSLLQITTAGVVTDLYDFPGGSTGSNPQSGLLETTPMTFWGTNLGDDGLIFKAVVSDGIATVTAPFGFSVANGATPTFPLIEYSDGSLYGTTNQGGSGSNGGYGTIFKYVPSTNQLTTVYDLNTSPATTGIYPDPLALGTDGNFYFPTIVSTTDCSSSINKLTPAGTLTTVYDGNTDAARMADIVQCPGSGLVQGADANYYGASQDGGSTGNYGDLYDVVPATAQKSPIQLTASTSTPAVGTPFTLSYTVLEAFSTSAQQCYAYVQGGAAGAGAWTGKQTGTASASSYKGSASITPTAAGTYTYALTCAGNHSGFLTLTVGGGSTKATSSISITAINSPNYGGTISIGVQVGSATNTGSAPTGTVTFVAGTTTLGTVTLTPGSGTVSTATLSVKDTLPKGKYALSITYNGDSSYNSSTLGANLTIAAITSDLSVGSVSTVQYKGVTSVNLTVSSATGSGPVPTGTVTVTIGSMAAATYNLTGGTGDSVTVNIGIQTTLAPGTYTVGVTYNGDNTYSLSSAGSNLTITPVPTTAALFAPTYARVGDNITFYYQVKSSSAVPTGTVQLYIQGAGNFGSAVTLAASQAYSDTAVASFTAPSSLTSQAPPSGTVPYGIYAIYTPSSGSYFGTSQTAGHNLYLNSSADAGLSFTINPSKTYYGSFVQLQSQATGTGTFTNGSFLYTFGNDVLGTETVNSLGSGNTPLSVPLGVAPAGTYTLQSTYTGDAKNSATAKSATLVVEPLFADATEGTDGSGNPTVTLNAWVAPSPGSTTYPTGTVYFAVTLPAAGSEPPQTVKFSFPLNSKGFASSGPQPVAGFPAGTYTVTATYNGDAHTGSSSYTFSATLQ